jgi:hypothetical protein
VFGVFFNVVFDLQFNIQCVYVDYVGIVLSGHTNPSLHIHTYEFELSFCFVSVDAEHFKPHLGVVYPT